MQSDLTSSQLGVVVGEWTPAVTDCAKYLNGRSIGSRYDGTYPGTEAVGSCSGLTGSASTFSDSYKTFLRQSWEAQVITYEKAQGWIQWTWRTESADEWSYKAGLANGWIPQDPTDLKFPDICGWTKDWDTETCSYLIYLVDIVHNTTFVVFGNFSYQIVLWTIVMLITYWQVTVLRLWSRFEWNLQSNLVYALHCASAYVHLSGGAAGFKHPAHLTHYFSSCWNQTTLRKRSEREALCQHIFRKLCFIGLATMGNLSSTSCWQASPNLNDLETKSRSVRREVSKSVPDSSFYGLIDVRFLLAFCCTFRPAILHQDGKEKAVEHVEQQMLYRHRLWRVRRG